MEKEQKPKKDVLKPMEKELKPIENVLKPMKLLLLLMLHSKLPQPSREQQLVREMKSNRSC